MRLRLAALLRRLADRIAPQYAAGGLVSSGSSHTINYYAGETVITPAQSRTFTNGIRWDG